MQGYINNLKHIPIYINNKNILLTSIENQNIKVAEYLLQKGVKLSKNDIAYPSFNECFSIVIQNKSIILVREFLKVIDHIPEECFFDAISSKSIDIVRE